MFQQLPLFEPPGDEDDALVLEALLDAPADLASYAFIIVFFSGGKDSIAALLTLLEAGASRERIELWHHEIDGREGSHLMDWPCTPAYCRAFAQAFALPLYASWKVGGFERELLRDRRPRLRQRLRLLTAACKWSVGRARSAGHAGVSRNSRPISQCAGAAPI